MTDEGELQFPMDPDLFGRLVFCLKRIDDWVVYTDGTEYHCVVPCRDDDLYLKLPLPATREEFCKAYLKILDLICALHKGYDKQKQEDILDAAYEEKTFAPLETI